MKHIFRIHTASFKSSKFRLALFTAILLLILSLFTNYFAGTYATDHEGPPVGDIILSNIPSFDVDVIFIYGAIIFFTGIFLLLVKDARLAPFTLKGISLFVLIRSFFVPLTHLGPFPGTDMISNFILNKLTFGGDLFFSGHTGLPFLLALAFWKNKYLRYTFLATSVFFGLTTLLGHLHYSIDVFAAYFITYSIYHLAQNLFRLDLEIFKSSPFSHYGSDDSLNAQA